MSKRRMHEHSLSAYYEGKVEVFTKREGQILAAYERVGKASDREIADELGFQDLNAVRPRITELIADGILREVGETKDPVTRKAVRVVEIIPATGTNCPQLNIWGVAS
jgi:predicted HTH transcriptional regulator